MKKIKEVQGSGFYIFSGSASGNSSFIENVGEAQLFSKYFNYYLSDYLLVYDYCINQHGWKFALKLKSKTTIRSRFKQNKKLESTKGWDIWRIISEQVRLALSTYVRVVNHKRGRSGSLVHSSYERHCFENISEGLSVISDMRNHELESNQNHLKYRALEDHYDIKAKEGKWNDWLCSGMRDGLKKEVESYVLHSVSDLVVQKLINRTLHLQKLKI